MSDQPVIANGVRVPRFLYGTAWKEHDTERLTALALRAGFRGIDTANQRKHYHEVGVGAAVTAALAQRIVTRDDLFVQTKFTFRSGQDDRLPYDPASPVAAQVEQSFTSSLTHLGVDVIDAYLLHGPSHSVGLSRDDWEAWRAMEGLHDAGRVRLIGVSNVTLEQLERLADGCRVRPAVVQNRCHAARGWDEEVRRYCAANNIVYQGFSLLTANRAVVGSAAVAGIASRRGWTPAQVVFRFALDVGMVALTGTTDESHMRRDLAILGSPLAPAELAAIEGVARR
jgi:diketogulonate reductase-like aldo/keto reductase